jgi:hypothetical protein
MSQNELFETDHKRHPFRRTNTRTHASSVDSPGNYHDCVAMNGKPILIFTVPRPKKPHGNCTQPKAYTEFAILNENGRSDESHPTGLIL